MDKRFTPVIDCLKAMNKTLTKREKIAQNYAPYRLFKEGDIVEPCHVNGRIDSRLSGCCRFKVLTNESDSEYNTVQVQPCLGDMPFFVNVAYLKLVSPVENQPYSIKECSFGQAVYICKNGKTYLTIAYGVEACFFQSRAEALAAAEAACARLNEEYGKEQN